MKGRILENGHQVLGEDNQRYDLPLRALDRENYPIVLVDATEVVLNSSKVYCFI